MGIPLRHASVETIHFKKYLCRNLLYVGTCNGGQPRSQSVHRLAFSDKAHASSLPKELERFFGTDWRPIGTCACYSFCCNICATMFFFNANARHVPSHAAAVLVY